MYFIVWRNRSIPRITPTCSPNSQSRSYPLFFLFVFILFIHLLSSPQNNPKLSMPDSLVFKGTLQGHGGWVTAIATSPENPDMILTASRGKFMFASLDELSSLTNRICNMQSERGLTNTTDKTIIVWQLTRDDSSFGFPKKILHGHNHFVSDVVISSDGQFALSSSWDKTLRLWDLNTGLTTRKFVGHTGDVLS